MLASAGRYRTKDDDVGRDVERGAGAGSTLLVENATLIA
jgi:hypothetical protein